MLETQPVKAHKTLTVDNVRAAGFTGTGDTMAEASASWLMKHRFRWMEDSSLEASRDIRSTVNLQLLFDAGAEWDFGNRVGWSDFASLDKDSVEMVIGVNNAEPHCDSTLGSMAEDFGGEVVNTVSVDGETWAVIVDLPRKTLSAFVSEVETSGMSRYIEPNLKGEVDFVPDDPEWSEQWGPRSIEAKYAWNTTIGDPSVLVAVIDTGIDWDHPDLAANYIPLGYDWVNNDTDPMDDHGHGTHCAGIIAAVVNNSIGIAGLAQAQIMAEKAFDSYGSGSEDDVAKAIIHAVDQEADILSNSWGFFGESILICEAVRYAQDHGVLLIAAAGNDASEYEQFPASLQEVVAVTATDESDNSAVFTNFGEWVEVAAPGVSVYSTWWNDTYTKASGTSMSTPHVAGVAALIWSQFPDMTRDQVRTQLRGAAEDLGDLGFDPYYGYGRINARKAVEHSLPNHDLALLYWDLPSILKPSDTILINATLLNYGANNESNMDVQLLVNGSVVDSAIIDHMKSGTSTTIRSAWNPLLEGRYNVTLHVDPVNGEASFGNNVLSKNVIVRIREEIAVPDDFPTIQKAINIARPGYTINVETGTYYEHIIIDKPVILVGEESQGTIIDGNGTEKVVWIAYANNVNLTGFTVQNGTYGLLLYGSNNSAINRNIITGNVEGVLLAYSGSNTFTKNNITRNDFNLDVTGVSLPHLVNQIDTSNTVDGKPIYYLVDQKNLTIDPKTFPDVGYLALIDCTNMTVKDLNLPKNGQGILLAFTNSSTMENINATGNIWGFLLVNCFHNTLYRNVITDNVYGMDLWDSNRNMIIDNMIGKCFDGVYLDMCNNNVIQDNNVTLVQYRDHIFEKRWGIIDLDGRNNTIIKNKVTETFMGISMGSSTINNITNNIIANNTYGLSSASCSNNTIAANQIAQNSVGIEMHMSNDSVIYHNDFINNKRQVESNISTSQWDDDYPSGGNYWSNYPGADLYHGPYQNETGSDGIGDTLYVIDAENRDNYPLWRPRNRPPVEHEVVVFLDAPSIIPPGYPSMLKATAVNKGLNDETSVEMQLMADGEIINSTVIPFLPAGSSYTLIDQWTSTIEDTYNITAYVIPVPNEESTANNAITKTVTVSAGTSIYVHPPEIIIRFGKAFMTNISVTAVEDLFCWQVRLYFNSAILNCTGASFPPNHIFADEQSVCLYNVNYTGSYIEVGATLLGGTPGYTGSGILCQIELKTVGLGRSDLKIGQYSNTTFLLDSELELIPDVALIKGTVEVEPISGDINMDSKVDMRDIALAGSALGSFPQHPRWNPQADINKDNKVDVKDLVMTAENFGETA